MFLAFWKTLFSDSHGGERGRHVRLHVAFVRLSDAWVWRHLVAQPGEERHKKRRRVVE
jgi:hypothetical protein